MWEKIKYKFNELYNSSFEKLKESYLGSAAALIVCVFCYKLNPSFTYFQSLFKDLAQISMIMFGFLMTVLSLFLQGNGSFYASIKTNISIYKRYITMNKRVVYLSFIISVFSLLLANIDVSYAQDLIINITILTVIKNCVISIYLGLLTKLLIDSYFFIDIFYCLLTNRVKQ